MKAIDDPREGLPSASGFWADVLCRGRRNLIRAIQAQGLTAPDNDAPSEAAARGTRIHRALEADSTLDLTPDELDAYNAAVRIKEQAIREWADEREVSGFTEGPREARLWLWSPETMSPMFSGQIDAHWLSDDARDLIVLDYKSGWAKQVAPAGRNWQLRTLALLAWKEYGNHPERIRVALAKPESRQEFDHCDFTTSDLSHIETHVRQALWEMDQPDAPLRAGDHCKWCPARANCPEALRWATAPIQSLKLVTPENGNGKITKETVASLVSVAPIEAVREVFGRRMAVKYILEAVSARLKNLPPEEHYRLGLKLNRGRKTDYVRDTRGAYDALVAAGFTDGDLWCCLSFDKTGLVELIQAMKNCRGSEAEIFFDTQLDEFIERSRGDATLAET